VNIAQLRDTVTTLLTMQPDLIGSYTLPDGKTIPAVYVVGQKGVPPEWKVAGMEATLRQYAAPRSRTGVGVAHALMQWEVMLVQYNPDGREIAQAMDRMIRRFPDATYQFLQGTDISYERLRIVIPDHQIKRLIH
jgi:hypothetical protein